MRISLEKNYFKLVLNINKVEARVFKIPKRLEIITGIILSILSFLAWRFYYLQGLVLSYNDARSHLNVARRVFDNLQPGLAQIGSVWLPFYHVLELIFVWNNFLWQSGLAGSIISMAAYIFGGVYLIKLARLMKMDFFGGILMLAVYALNPNMIFMQATPMTESLLIFLSIASIYHLLCWAKSFSLYNFILAGVFILLSTLTRYDGWFLLFFSALVVFIISFKKRGYQFSEGVSVMFLTLAGFGVFLWILWNLVIFGDPLYFILGPFSAKSQQDVLLAEGRLLSKYNPVYSFFLYLLAVIENVGLPIFVLSVVGFFYMLKDKLLKWRIKLILILLFTPFIFNVLSLIAGHSVLHLPQIFPFTWFNDRYGLMLLPMVSFSLGYLVRGRKAVFFLIIAILITQTANMYINNKVITIEDGIRGASGEYLDEAGNWIKNNVYDGLILVAASSNDALIFKTGLDLKNFITEGARDYWDTSMIDPTVYAKWIVMHKGDLVYQNLNDNDLFLNNYKLVYKDAFSYIYKLDKNKGRLSEDQLPR